MVVKSYIVCVSWMNFGDEDDAEVLLAKKQFDDIEWELKTNFCVEKVPLKRNKSVKREYFHLSSKTKNEPINTIAKAFLSVPYFLKDLGVLSVNVTSSNCGNCNVELLERTIQALPFSFINDALRIKHKNKCPTIAFDKAVEGPLVSKENSWVFSINCENRQVSDRKTTDHQRPGIKYMDKATTPIMTQKDADISVKNISEAKPIAKEVPLKYASEFELLSEQAACQDRPLFDDMQISNLENEMQVRVIKAKELKLDIGSSRDNSVRLYEEAAGEVELMTLFPGEKISLKVIVGFGYGDLNSRFLPCKTMIWPEASITLKKDLDSKNLHTQDKHKQHKSVQPMTVERKNALLARMIYYACPQNVFDIEDLSPKPCKRSTSKASSPSSPPSTLIIKRPQQCIYCMKCTEVDIKSSTKIMQIQKEQLYLQNIQSPFDVSKTDNNLQLRKKQIKDDALKLQTPVNIQENQSSWLIGIESHHGTSPLTLWLEIINFLRNENMPRL